MKKKTTKKKPDKKKKLSAKKKKQVALMWIFIWTFNCMVVGMCFGILYNDARVDRIDRIHAERDNFNSNFLSLCGDSYNINATAKCIKDFVNITYNYHEENDAKAMERHYMEIYENGGDCLDYSILYSHLINLYDYYDSKVIISYEDGHAYVLMEDWDGNACVLDLMREPQCGKNKNFERQEIVRAENLTWTDVE